MDGLPEEICNMCNIEKYKKIYDEISQLDSEDTLQLELNADSEDERDFYEMIENYLIQKRQKKVVAENLF